MKRLILLSALALLFPQLAHGDEVLPSVDKEQMDQFKSTFGKAVADSKNVTPDKDRDADSKGKSDANDARGNHGHPDGSGSDGSAAHGKGRN